MASFDEVLLHPCIKKIDEMCLKDEPVTQVVNWVKNTIDADESIPADKKQDYYLTVSKVSAYKKELMSSAQNVTVKMENPMVITGTAVDIADVQITPGIDRVRQGIIEKHAEKSLINIHKTLENLAVRIQTQMEVFELALTDNTIIDPDMHKAYRGYINSFTNLLRELSEVTGYKDYYKKMGENFGNAASMDILDKEKKAKLKEFTLQLLMEVGNVDLIPTYLAKLEEILERPNKDK